MAWQETALNALVKGGNTNPIPKAVSPVSVGEQRAFFLSPTTFATFEVDPSIPDIACYSIFDTQTGKKEVTVVQPGKTIEASTYRGGEVIFEWVPSI